MGTELIDLRSDTVTKPTPGMLDAMMHARVGDDVFGEDETVNALQEKAAKLFGMEAALFCASGTMTNQIAIKLHTKPGDEVICDKTAHVYLYEGGGIAYNSGASVRLLDGDRGRFSADDVAANINNRADVHFPLSSLVCIENTVNRGGGACWDLSAISEIKALCKAQQLSLHLDGARLFNALIAGNEQAADYGRLFDSISICLSKGLGAPVGSLLLASAENIAKARRIRKVMGGGMRQAGFLAAAGIYALDHHVQRLAEDHKKAKAVEAVLKSSGYVEELLPVETNIVIFTLNDAISKENFQQQLAEKGIRAVVMGAKAIRFVTHLDISEAMLERLLDALRAIRT